MKKFTLAWIAAQSAMALALAPAAQAGLQSPPTSAQDLPGPSTVHQVNSHDDQVDANIAWTTAEMLEQYHYLQHPFDQEISSKFLDRLESLDYDHMFFLQSDLDDFKVYRTDLGVLTLRKHDLTPCWTIFSRFLDRVRERTAYATNLLATQKFDFDDAHERFNPFRHTLPAPKDMDEARNLWREDLRFRYLDEKLKEPNIQFVGPAVPDGAGTVAISLKREKAHPLSFDLLPRDFLDANGRTIGSLHAFENGSAPVAREKLQSPGTDSLPKDLLDANGHSIGSIQISENTSNAVLRLQVPADASLRKLTNVFFSRDGKRLGSITFQREVSETEASETQTNAANPSGHPSTNLVKTSSLQGIVELDRKDMAGINKKLTNYYCTVLKNYSDLTNDHYLVEWYLNSLAHAYDPHSDFMGAAQSENFKIQMNLSLFGIGARLMLDGDYCKIEDLVPEGPASKSGQLKSGDSIVAVAQKGQEPVDVIGMPLQKVVDMIRGPKNTEVKLTILRTGADDSSVRKIVSLVRDEIRLEDQRAKARLYETPASGETGPQRIGVIDLSSFYGAMDNDQAQIKSTTLDVVKLIERLKKEKVEGIILDLRRNGGGFLEEAIKLTGLFITKGPVVQTREFNGEIVADSDPDPSILYDGPLIVLTSRFSASASEILAGALQDYGRAMIIGDKSTFGKGTVQTMQNLAPIMEQRGRNFTYDPGPRKYASPNGPVEPGSLKLTIKKFYRAGGSSTQLNGVVPDIVLPSRLNDDPDVGEVALPNALPWDDVTSTEFQRYNMVNAYQPELLKHSLARQEKDKDFAYVREDIEEYKKWLADRSVSLNEADRLTEQKQREARGEARKKERLARKKTNDLVYEITLKNYDAAALDLVSKTNSVAGASNNLDDDSADDESSDTALFSDDEVRLIETRRIMADYIAMLHKSPAISQAARTRTTLANPLPGQ